MKKFGLVSLFAWLVGNLGLAQTTWYVDVSATPPGNGSIANPYASIQYAINQPATTSGDTILVAPGTYLEWIDYSGKSIALKSTHGPNVTKLGTGAGAYFDIGIVTVQNGEAVGTSLEGFGFVAGLGTFSRCIASVGSSLRIESCTAQDLANANPGAFLNAKDSSVLVSKCDIQRLTAQRSGWGGAIRSEGGFLEVVDCSISGCLIYSSGGAMAVIGGSVSVRNCLFRGNRCGVDGGAIMTLGADLDCRDSVFFGNLAGDGNGGAIDCSGLSTTIVNCAFSHNRSSERHGGGIRSYSAVLSVRDSLFLQNMALRGCGAWITSGVGTFERCRFERNRTEPYYSGFNALGAGLGASTTPGTAAIAKHCDFVGNTVRTWPGSSGGGAHNATLENCVLAANGFLDVGGPYEGSAASNSILRNCIVWGNATLGTVLTNSCSATWSDVQGGFPGTGNVSIDPMFWEASTGDFHLRWQSPCINAGDPSSPLDPDGSVADMGAYPFATSYVGGATIYCAAKVNSLGCTPAIGHNSALPSVSGGSFGVFLLRIRPELGGIFFWGSGAAAVPFQGGTLCVQAPLVRTPIQSSASCSSVDGCPPGPCLGSHWFQWTSAYMASQGLSAGVSVACQAWTRDPDDPFTTGLSNAVLFTLYP